VNRRLWPSPPRAQEVQCLMQSFLKQELLDRLAEIEASIATGASNISRQREHVAELERNGLDASLSKSVMTSFEGTQAIRHEEFARLVDELEAAVAALKPA
jgi:hypothetical protein